MKQQVIREKKDRKENKLTTIQAEKKLLLSI